MHVAVSVAAMDATYGADVAAEKILLRVRVIILILMLVIAIIKLIIVILVIMIKKIPQILYPTPTQPCPIAATMPLTWAQILWSAEPTQLAKIFSFRNAVCAPRVAKIDLISAGLNHLKL